MSRSNKKIGTVEGILEEIETIINTQTQPSGAQYIENALGELTFYDGTPPFLVIRNAPELPNQEELFNNIYSAATGSGLIWYDHNGQIHNPRSKSVNPDQESS